MSEQAAILFELSVEEMQIVEQLSYCHGLENAVSNRKLAALTGIEERKAQDLVKHLVEEHHYPIGSATGKPHGYYWITTAEEQERSEKQLEHRIISTARRLARLRKNTPHAILLQLSLDMETEEARV